MEEKLVALSELIEESDDAPTQGARDVLAKLELQVREQLAALRQALDEDVRAFNALVGVLPGACAIAGRERAAACLAAVVVVLRTPRAGPASAADRGLGLSGRSPEL